MKKPSQEQYKKAEQALESNYHAPISRCNRCSWPYVVEMRFCTYCHSMEPDKRVENEDKAV